MPLELKVAGLTNRGLRHFSFRGEREDQQRQSVSLSDNQGRGAHVSVRRQGRVDVKQDGSDGPDDDQTT